MYDIIKLHSANSRPRKTSTPISIIVHSIGYSFDNSIKVLTEEASQVSAHYFIPQATSRELLISHPDLFYEKNIKHPDSVPVILLVEEEDCSFHAGISAWKDWNALPGCAQNLNDCSIGIEFHSEGYAGGDGSDLFCFKPYNELQIFTGAMLMHDIARRWEINHSNILAHSDISFIRPDGTYKTDPGPLFPWRILHDKYGVGIYPKVKKAGNIINDDVKSVQSMLGSLGYACPLTGQLDLRTKYCINAYRMHFLHEEWVEFNGGIDESLLYNLSCHMVQHLMV